MQWYRIGFASYVQNILFNIEFGWKKSAHLLSVLFSIVFILLSIVF